MEADALEKNHAKLEEDHEKLLREYDYVKKGLLEVIDELVDQAEADANEIQERVDMILEEAADLE